MSTCGVVAYARFMRQGHFDELRKAIFRDFLSSEQHKEFREQLELFLHEHVSQDAERLAYRDARLRQSDVMRALDQHPIFEQLLTVLSQDRGENGLCFGEDGRVAEQVRSQLRSMLYSHITLPNDEHPV